MNKFNFNKLDSRTRELMIEEINNAISDGELYYSTRFNNVGQQGWAGWLVSAAENHDEHWLAFQLESAGAMKEYETRTKPSGGYTTAHIPDTAAETLSDGQFNRFYIAAVCRRAIEDGLSHVRVYRAKLRGEPRAESRALEGTELNASELLESVRNCQSSFRVELLKPNSGLSVDY